MMPIFKGDRRPHRLAIASVMRLEQSKPHTKDYMTEKPNPSNEIHSVGFPEGQLLGNGATAQESAEISAAYLQGKPLPVSENPVINRISERLTQTSGYGQHRDRGHE